MTQEGVIDAQGIADILIAAERERRGIAQISDDGAGLPEAFDWRSSPSLGLSIVNTLVGDMGGEFRLGQNPQGPGTQAVIEVPLKKKKR